MQRGKSRGWPVSRVLSKGLAPLWMTIPLVPPLPTGSSCQPGSAGAQAALRGCPRARSLFGIAPGGACPAGPVARPAVGFYPTVSPLPAAAPLEGAPPPAVCSLWRFPWGCPRRALPGTMPAWSPDFPRHPSRGRRGHPAIRAVAQIGMARAAVKPGRGPGSGTGGWAVSPAGSRPGSDRDSPRAAAAGSGSRGECRRESRARFRRP